MPLILLLMKSEVILGFSEPQRHKDHKDQYLILFVGGHRRVACGDVLVIMEH